MKTKPIYLLIILSSLFLNNFYSQESDDYRLIVGVTEFTTTDVRQERFANMITERVLDVLNQQNRFQVIDLDGKARTNVIDKSKENYKSKNWLESNKSINAEYTLAGIITSIKFIRLNAGKGYKATITYNIKIINTESGEIIKNGTGTFSSSKSDIKLTPESALQSAMQTTVTPLSLYFSNSFPIKLNLVRIEKEKKEKALSVLLGGGSKVGISLGTKYEAYFIDDSLGKPLPKFIGEIKITKVLSEDFSEAKVTDGGKEIFKYLNEDKKIICKSKNNEK